MNYTNAATCPAACLIAAMERNLLEATRFGEHAESRLLASTRSAGFAGRSDRALYVAPRSARVTPLTNCLIEQPIFENDVHDIGRAEQRCTIRQ
jgi:hypothetical protein